MGEHGRVTCSVQAGRATGGREHDHGRVTGSEVPDEPRGAVYGWLAFTAQRHSTQAVKTPDWTGGVPATRSRVRQVAGR